MRKEYPKDKQNVNLLQCSPEKTAADFIAACTKASDEACVPVRDGVIFEHFLSLLATSGHDLC